LNYYYGSTVLCWALAAFSVSWSYTQSVGLLGRGISPSQGLYLHTEQKKYKIKAHNKDIHALSGIRTLDPSVRGSEDSSCLRPRDHCGRRWRYWCKNMKNMSYEVPSRLQCLSQWHGTCSRARGQNHKKPLIALILWKKWIGFNVIQSRMPQKIRIRRTWNRWMYTRKHTTKASVFLPV
jgi:hypothetical protein